MATWKAGLIGAVAYIVAGALTIAAAEWFGPKAVLIALGVPLLATVGAMWGVWTLGRRS